MNLLPVLPTEAENSLFQAHPDSWENVLACIDFYNRVGFNPPWICYIVEKDGQFVGGAGIKGKPVNNMIEIAYGTFPAFQQQGIATQACRELVLLAQHTDPSLRITARTFLQENYSTKVLKKNGFRCLGMVNDPEDGDVWEWEYGDSQK